MYREKHDKYWSNPWARKERFWIVNMPVQKPKFQQSLKQFDIKLKFQRRVWENRLEPANAFYSQLQLGQRSEQNEQTDLGRERILQGGVEIIGFQSDGV